jgi:hypothetical protein
MLDTLDSDEKVPLLKIPTSLFEIEYGYNSKILRSYMEH